MRRLIGAALMVFAAYGVQQMRDPGRYGIVIGVLCAVLVMLSSRGSRASFKSGR